MNTGFDPDDPTLIAKVRTPLTSRSLITLAAVAEMKPKHTVHIEDGWLVLRLLPVSADEVIEPCEHDTLGCGDRVDHQEHARTGDGRPCCGWPPSCREGGAA